MSMPKQTIRLIAFKDENTGEIGLGLLDMPYDDQINAAVDGLLIAHDILEHQNGPENIGTIDDELEALGGIWYVRGQHGELRRGASSRYSVHENIAFDITRMFRDFFYGTPVDTNPLPDVECEADADLREIISCASNHIRSEVDNDASDEELEQRKNQYFSICLPRLRIGYEKAKARFEEYGRFFANDLFWAIADAVDPHAKNVEYALTIGVYPDGRPYAHCEVYYSEDEDY